MSISVISTVRREGGGGLAAKSESPFGQLIGSIIPFDISVHENTEETFFIR